MTVDPVTGRVPRNAQPLWNIGTREYVSLFHDGGSKRWTPMIRKANSEIPLGKTCPPTFPALWPLRRSSR